MAATVCPPPKFVGLDNSGNPLSSGKLYSYLAGTSTPAAMYATPSGYYEFIVKKPTNQAIGSKLNK